MNAINVLVILLGVFLASEAGHHERRHRVREREAENRTDVENSELPSINEVKHFKIPDVFTQAKSTRQADDEPEDNNEVIRHHGRRHHGAHSH